MVGRVHFIATIGIALMVVFCYPETFSRARLHVNQVTLFWIPLWTSVLCFLQPLTALLWKIEANCAGLIPDQLVAPVSLAANIISPLLVPIWSVFFGWAFVKLDNWLNHFPVLGKRVF
jgi:hypothetical protein